MPFFSKTFKHGYLPMYEHSKICPKAQTRYDPATRWWFSNHRDQHDAAPVTRATQRWHGVIFSGDNDISEILFGHHVGQSFLLSCLQGPVSIWRRFPMYGYFHCKDITVYRLIVIMRIPILVRRHPNFETNPCWLSRPIMCQPAMAWH